MRILLIAFALTLLALPALAYGPAIVIHGVAGGTAVIFDHHDFGRMLVVEGADFGASDEEINHNGPMIIIDGVAYGPIIVKDGLAYGPAIVIHGVVEDDTNDYGPAIVIHG